VHNPFAEGYSAGGSTSGGAAVVGGGLVDIALGADQGGSIRVPSSFCGCKYVFKDMRLEADKTYNRCGTEADSRSGPLHWYL
jgi:hypothetical protein